MSRFVPHGDMSTDELMDCLSEAEAIMNLCAAAADSVFNEIGDKDVLSANISTALRLAATLLDPVRGALEVHEGVARKTVTRMTGGQRNG